MPRRAARQPVSRQQGSDQENKRPGGQQGRFHEFPTKDGLRGYGQRGQEVCFPVAKKISVTNDDIAKEEQNKKEGEQ